MDDGPPLVQAPTYRLERRWRGLARKPPSETRRHALMLAVALSVGACGSAEPEHPRVRLGEGPLATRVFAGAAALIYAQHMCRLLGPCLGEVSDAWCVRKVGDRVLREARSAGLPDPVPPEVQLRWFEDVGRTAVIEEVGRLGEVPQGCQLRTSGAALTVEWRAGGCVRLEDDPTPCPED
ncbi:MAG: hypothetical protein ACFCGT_23825 [Sandaracinaceae bacterium]